MNKQTTSVQTEWSSKQPSSYTFEDWKSGTRSLKEEFDFTEILGDRFLTNSTPVVYLLGRSLGFFTASHCVTLANIAQQRCEVAAAETYYK